ncbi:MAG: gliding motility-associated C-terminal domain-containing protein [Bacteroidales bacterium]|nr:gliding motility-associated C-terminal domain-containing protein [Bacteroidales bacterium]
MPRITAAVALPLLRSLQQLRLSLTGVTPVTITVTDAGGNSVDCNADVIVIDDTDPVLVTVDTTVYIGAGNIATIDSSYVYDPLASSDNCGITNVTIDVSTFDCSMLGANTVNVTAYDNAGNAATGTAVVTVSDTNTVVADAGPDDSMCITDGTYILSSAAVSNGTVLWGTTGDGSFDDPALVNPVYTLGATDSDSVKLYMDVTPLTGCSAASDTMKLTINEAPVADAGDDIDICTGTTDVAISTASYADGTILWTSSGDGSFDDDSVIDPVYTPGVSDTDSVTLYLTVTGAGSCGTAIDSMKIRVFEAPVADAGADDAVCASETDYVIADASSGGGTVLWTTDGDGSFDDATVDNPVYTFGAADYSNGNVTLTMTVTGVGTCGDDTDDKIITINELPGITVDEHADISCNGLNDGIIRISGSGGTAPYQYSIDGGAYQASGDFTGLSAGDYDLSLIDANGCLKDTIMSIAEPGVFSFNLDNVTHNSCYGSDDASISITISGGTEPYAINWTGPDGFTSTEEDLSDLAAGLYSLNLTDANNCNVFTLDTTITEPPQIVITEVDMSDYNGYGVSCYGSTDGYIEVDVSGGSGALTLSWEGPGGFTSAEEDISDLQAGSYTLTVTDDLGCSETYEVTLTEPDELLVSYNVTDASCPGVEDGSIDLTIAGGVTPYTILWNDGETIGDRSAIADGDYTVTVTDASGCTATEYITVGVIGINCVVVPEVITPGVVDGKNDVLQIRHISLHPDAEIKIFSRWGKLIYQAKNLEENQWDGTYKGKALPVDSYHYILDLGDGSTPRTGTITIIR